MKGFHVFKLTNRKPASSIFRNRPRALAADEVKNVAGGGGGDHTSKKAPYDMDYATRHF